jgi:hypothetical protein
MTRITEHAWKRRLPPELRRELFTYVPRGRAVGMEPERFEAVLRAYGREDLAERALKLMGLKDKDDS